VILKVAGVVGHEDITALVQKDKRAPLAMASADVPLRSPVPMTAAPEPKARTPERKPQRAVATHCRRGNIVLAG